jgi:hypothetical protein
MRQTAIVLFVAGTLAAVPSTGLCQAAPIARADFTAATGSFSSNRGELVDNYERWPHTAFGSLAAGLYWTDHLKSEVEVARTGTAELYGFEYLGLPEAPGFGVPVERRFDSVKVSAAQLVQFGRNARFHPFIGAGIDVDRERAVYERRGQNQLIYGAGGRVERAISVPPQSTSRTTTHVRGFGTGGFKGYFSERGFFRTELKVQVGSRLEQVMWKMGLGVDF